MDTTKSAHKISVAPMMGYTDRHARYLFRLISPHAVLYSEMINARALLHGENENLLRFNAEEHPLVMQLGGSDPAEMAKAAMLAEDAGYDEININVGCPSDRVQSGAFGACLMATPELVAEIFSAIQSAVDIPATIKHRIGIDDQDSFTDLEHFVMTVAESGCTTFIIHARKAWLKGLSPKQNRDIPPIDYGRVYRLKQDHPDLKIIINGAIKTVEQVMSHLAHTDGVMIGREVFSQPWLLAEIEQSLYQDGQGLLTRIEVQKLYAQYIEKELQKGTSAHALVKPLSGLYHGLNGAKYWRRLLTETVQKRPNAINDLAELVAGYKQ
jgi:tRNA-dihydrouridine synthase A